MIWLDIEGPQYWMDQGSNQQFFSEMVAEANALGVHLGVYTSESQVNFFFALFCLSVTSGFPLWVTGAEDLLILCGMLTMMVQLLSVTFLHLVDGQLLLSSNLMVTQKINNSNDFLGNVALCGCGTDLNWYP
jgi:predicted signal transduction protein with EAL and GGDEF domain